MPNFEWDDNQTPLAYLITIRTYGTWFHGDERSSVDRHGQNIHNTPRVKSTKKLNRIMERNLVQGPFLLDAHCRGAVEAAIKEVCDHRLYQLFAVNVRTNHAHVVAAGQVRPERIATEFKSYSTRRMRDHGMVAPNRRVWSRGESTRYLWKERHVELAVNYVLYGQGDELPKF
jgi:REP element-mobilizing transposase RayT